MITVKRTRINGDLLEIDFETSEPDEIIVLAEPSRNPAGQIESVRVYAPNPGAVCTMGRPLTPTASPLKVQGRFQAQVKIITEGSDGRESEQEICVK